MHGRGNSNVMTLTPRKQNLKASRIIGMSLFYGAGSPTTEFTAAEAKAALFSALDKLGERKKVLAVPPDFTRMHSMAGQLTEYAWNYYGDALTVVLPALGTHKAMTDHEIQTMYGPTPRDLFRVHDWRNDIVTLGEVPSEFERRQGGLHLAGAGEQAAAGRRA
jgi:hypothetical protein